VVDYFRFLVRVQENHVVLVDLETTPVVHNQEGPPSVETADAGSIHRAGLPHSPHVEDFPNPSVL